MCFHSKQSKDAQSLINRFDAKLHQKTLFTPQEQINGFTFPQTPVICHQSPQLIEHLNWGLIPYWAKDDSIRQFTLNAKIETLEEKPSFKDSVDKRCLIIADGFYEWQWLDSNGKNKQKYLISLPNNELFAFAGIWSEWMNPVDKKKVKSYSIVTTAANDLMSEIHNSKRRMPIILGQENERDWLNGAQLEEFAIVDIELKAQKQTSQLELGF